MCSTTGELDNLILSNLYSFGLGYRGSYRPGEACHGFYNLSRGGHHTIYNVDEGLPYIGDNSSTGMWVMHIRLAVSETYIHTDWGWQEGGLPSHDFE